jgi:hypothetical protein
MRLVVRFGPFWVSSGGGRRRRTTIPAWKVLVIAACIIAVADALASGGWWAALGWTIVGVFVLVMAVRMVKHKDGAQHVGGSQDISEVPAAPVSDRMYHSDRR